MLDLAVEPFMLVLHGPICGGKTHFARFLGKHARLFVVGSDKIKWCISDYSIKKYGGTGIVNTLMYRLIEEAVLQGFPIVVEGNLRLRRERLSDLADLCARHNMTFLEVNVEAPIEEVEKRFARRLEHSNKAGIRLAEKSLSNVAKRYRRYLNDRDPALPTLDTSTMSMQEMARAVEALLTRGQAEVQSG